MEEVRKNKGIDVTAEAAPLPPCPICNTAIGADQPRIECVWCRLEFHENCEPRVETCPSCGRYLPTAKTKALSRDRKRTAILLVVPFVVIEIIIAFISWLSHPGVLSVPDIEHWFSVGLIVNITLLIVAMVSMGVAALKGEGPEESKPKNTPSE